MLTRAALLAPGLALLLAAPGAATPPRRGVDYVGSVSGGGRVSLRVWRDGRRFAEARFTGLPATCDGQPSTESFGGGPIPISPAGLFRHGIPDAEQSGIRGRFLRGGRASGRVGYSDRGGCTAGGSWTARALPRRPVDRTPIFRLGPQALAVDEEPDGSLLAADPGYSRDRYAGTVVRIETTGRVTALARLSGASDVAALPGSGVLVADAANHCVRRVDGAGTISTVAGRCAPEPASGDPGDGGPATAAVLHDPEAVAATADGGFLIADSQDARVRRVSAAGTISTVAGTGQAGFSGDGGPAASARIGNPTDVAALPGGVFLIADPDNERVREVSAGGTISTRAGTGVGGFSGDGVPATAAGLDHPIAVAATARGGFLIAEWGRVREVDAGGRISTVAGPGLASDGAPAGLARLFLPYRLTALREGGFATVDALRLRVVTRAKRRLLVAIRGSVDALRRTVVHARPGAAALLRLSANRPCRIAVTVRRPRAPALTVSARIRRRGAAVRLPRALAPGAYALTATARVGRLRAAAAARLEVR
jgi:hypothetical protein